MLRRKHQNVFLQIDQALLDTSDHVRDKCNGRTMCYDQICFIHIVASRISDEALSSRRIFIRRALPETVTAQVLPIPRHQQCGTNPSGV